MPFAPKARFLHGEPVMVDYTNPTTNTINAGDVVVDSNSLRIAHSDIAGSALGAVAAGGGVYEFLNGSNGAAFTEGNLVRWDATNQVPIGGTVAANLKVGSAIGTVTTNSASVIVKHVDGLNI